MFRRVCYYLVAFSTEMIMISEKDGLGMHAHVSESVVISCRSLAGYAVLC